MLNFIPNTLTFETNYKIDLSKLDYDKAARLNAVDIWICTYYKKLPTEKAFQELSDEAKFLLFQGFLNSPSSEELKEHNMNRIKAEQEQFSNSALKKAGYTDEDIQMIRAQMAQAALGIEDPNILGG